MDFETAITVGVWVLGLSPILGSLLWSLWQAVVRPQLIPMSTISELADRLVAQHGMHAEEIALVEEDRACRRLETFEQAKWRRVRRELWRRHGAGEWTGPEA